MKKRLLFILPLLLAWVLVLGGATARAQSATNADDVAVQAKARELVQGKETRIEKLVALQVFVRDEIAQAKTQFG